MLAGDFSKWVIWLVPVWPASLGLAVRSCTVIRLPIITSLSVGPNTLGEGPSQPRLQSPVSLSIAAETLAASVARSERFGLTVGGDVIMVGSMRWLGAALTGLSLITGTGSGRRDRGHFVA